MPVVEIAGQDMGRKAVPAVDAHAHVFTRECALVSAPRYVPDYEAPLEEYRGLLDDHAIARGVLVQPSFLGTDNTYLLDCLDRSAGRLSGVVVLDPRISDDALRNMTVRGVTGLRFNLIGEDETKLAHPAWRRLAWRVAHLGWHIQLHVEGPRLPNALAALSGIDVVVVVDHFGRPDPALGRSDPGLRTILGARDASLMVKMSGDYRLGTAKARTYAAALLDSLGPERLVWGSDWPWTNHEDGRSFGERLDGLNGLCGGDDGVVLALGRTASRLYAPIMATATERRAWLG